MPTEKGEQSPSENTEEIKILQAEGTNATLTVTATLVSRLDKLRWNGSDELALFRMPEQTTQQK